MEEIMYLKLVNVNSAIYIILKTAAFWDTNCPFNYKYCKIDISDIDAGYIKDFIEKDDPHVDELIANLDCDYDSIESALYDFFVTNISKLFRHVPTGRVYCKKEDQPQCHLEILQLIENTASLRSAGLEVGWEEE